MIKRNGSVVLALSLMCSLLVFSCAKSESPEQEAAEKSAPLSPSMQPAAEEAGEADMSLARERAGKEDATGGLDKSLDGLGPHFLTPMDMAKERMLEYSVTVSYECKDILVSRKTLLGLVARYGFIKRSSATTESREPTADVEIMVAADKLYEALQDFETLGILKNEDITVQDHTASMVTSRRRVDRENIRIMRRNKAMGQITAQGKNWQQVENAIEQSEDKLDQAEQEKWDIQDRVAWATVRLHLKGPDMPNRIEVPLYRNALVGLVNLFLGMVYLLIWLLPLAILGILLWVGRGRIKALFIRKKTT